jgi:hypothetical protein
MPNPIKYSTGSETLALKKGNLYIGTGAVGKGPSETTGYYQGPNVPSGGYVIYMNKEGVPGNLSYHSAANDAQLISFTNSIAGQSYTGVNQCFDYYYSQNDKVLVNQDYPVDFPYIVLDGLVLYLDAGITQSYSGSGTTWLDINGLGPKNNGTLTNGPTYNSANGGSIVFDGVDDYVTSTPVQPTLFTLSSWFKATGPPTNNDSTGGALITSSPQLFGGTVQYGLFYSWLSERLIFLVQTNTEFLPTLNNNILRNTIYNVVGVYNGEQRRIYVNGVLNNTDNFTTNPIYPGSGEINTQIGRWGFSGYERNFNGNIFNTMIYNRALSASEVLQNYNAQKGRFGL